MVLWCAPMPGLPVGSDGPMWTRFAAAAGDPLTDGLVYPANDRRPWIARGAGVYDNVSKTYHGAWDAGMAFVMQGWAPAFSSMLRQPPRTGAGTGERSRGPVHIPRHVAPCSISTGGGRYMALPALTRAAWGTACSDTFDMIQQYYVGSQGTHATQSLHFGNSTNGIGRVLLRRDGFVGWSAAGSASSVTATNNVIVTEPFYVAGPSQCSGEHERVVLLLNSKNPTSGTSGLRVGFKWAGANSADAPGFELGASDIITTDYVRAVASWHGGRSDLEGIAARPVVMTLALQHGTEVYAWEFRCVAP